MTIRCALLILTPFLLLNGSRIMTDTPSAKTPLPRKEAFFGMHFDLHPQKTDTTLGAETSEENIAQLLRRVKPDYVQYDCKGHAGYTGYPTQVGTPSPGIVKDSLQIWRDVTREHGVGLYIHYSGVWDSVAVQQNPDWAKQDISGNKSQDKASTFGDYVDRLLIPQLKEVCAKYELDGAWVDGECWAVEWDYSPAAMAAWQKETGETTAPKDRSDARWAAWKAFQRKQFERYLAHWVDSLHAFNPKLQLTSNWMYTTFAPKPIEAKLDFLSGDYSPSGSVDTARIEARYIASAGMPWDLMAWGFNWGQDQGHSLKSAVHLQQEAAVVLMQGGGFQIYYQPTRSGYLAPEIIETAGQVADFCRARQTVSHKSRSVPQVALLLSSETFWDRMDSPFGNWGVYDELKGALDMLSAQHYSVDILAEHQLLPRLQEYPLVVLPDCSKLSDSFRDALLNYVKEGGSLLLLGEKCARLFEPALNVTLEGAPQNMPAEIKSGPTLANVNGVWQTVRLKENAQAVGFRYGSRDTRQEGTIAATLTAYGAGKIGAVWGPLALNYHRSHHPAVRAFTSEIVKKLFPVPIAQIEAPASVEIALRRTPKGELSLHLLNLSNVQRADRFLHSEEITPLSNLKVRLQTPKRPKSVRWVPEGGTLKWQWSKGWLSVTLPSLKVHGVLVVEE